LRYAIAVFACTTPSTVDTRSRSGGVSQVIGLADDG
jgi:hypothetical protein